MHARLSLFLALLLMLGSAARAEPAPAAEALTLAEVLAQVRTRHPALEAARLNASAAEERVAQEGAWEDPRAELRFGRDGTRALTGIAMTELELSQSLPLSGRNRARAEVARAEVGEVLADLPVRELELLSAARSAYYDLATAEQEQAIIARAEVLLTTIRDNVQQRYGANRGPLSDVYAAETELALLRERGLELIGRRDSARARLNVLMQRPPDAPLPPAVPLEIPQKTPVLTHFLELARAHSPLIAQAGRRTATAESKARLARLNTRPDPEIMIAARRHNGSSRFVDEYDTGIGLSLPWANPRRNRAERAAADRLVTAAGQELAAVEQEVLARVAAAWHELAAYRDCCRLYRDTVIPLAQQGVDAARRSFEAGQIPLGDLLDAQQRLLEAETGYVTRLQEYFQGLTALENATGVIHPEPILP